MVLSDFVSPLPGGMVRVVLDRHSVTVCFPPARGDGPMFLLLTVRTGEFPPCPGGWSAITETQALEKPVSPLPGGMVRLM